MKEVVKRKVGRPKTGQRPAVTIRLDAKTLARVEQIRFGDKLGTVLRELIERGLRK